MRHTRRLLCVGLLSGGLWAGAWPQPPEDVVVVGAEELLADAAVAQSTLDILDPLAGFREPAPDNRCDDGTTRWADAVQGITRRLARQRIPYKPSILADCSGMAHRVLRELGSRCSETKRPPVVVARRARDLARWYEQEGLLTHIPDLEAADAALEVGALAFYLSPGRSKGGLDNVYHIGIVVDVERDEAGRVQRYSLFHGRRPGIVASITKWHTRDARVPLGNGNERLIAIAVPHADPDDGGMVVADDWTDDDHDRMLD